MTKAAFLAAVGAEIDRIVFLAAKVTPDDLDYRPTPNSRSMRELIRYLATAAIVPAKAMVEGNYDHYSGYKEKSDTLEFDAFEAGMRKQEEEIREVVTSISDEGWTGAEAALPWGVSRAMCDAMVESTLAFLTAYRMQLFLYLKANGHDNYSTYECWAGLDNPKRVAADA